MSGHYKRAISSAMMVGFGNAGGIVASNIFISAEAPAYPTGYGTTLGLLWLCKIRNDHSRIPHKISTDHFASSLGALLCTAFLIGVMLENKKRDRGERDYRLEGPDADNLGDGELAHGCNTSCNIEPLLTLCPIRPQPLSLHILRFICIVQVWPEMCVCHAMAQ